MPTVYGRVKPKAGVEKFYRCSLLFTALWAMFEVDAATKRRLDEEQMIEVTETKPKDYVEATVAEVIQQTAASDNLDDDQQANTDAQTGNQAPADLNVPGTSSDNSAGDTSSTSEVNADASGNQEVSIAEGDATITGDSSGGDTSGDDASGTQTASNTTAEAKVTETSTETDPIAALVTIIAGLDKANAQLWRKDGSPTTAALGDGVSAKDRDAAWAAFNASGTN